MTRHPPIRHCHKHTNGTLIHPPQIVANDPVLFVDLPFGRQFSMSGGAGVVYTKSRRRDGICFDTGGPLDFSVKPEPDTKVWEVRDALPPTQRREDACPHCGWYVDEDGTVWTNVGPVTH